MDSTLIASIIIAVVAIIPGAWALINQGKKDNAQSKIDINKATQDAAVSIIAPLQGEVTRLQNRVIELENALIEKTTEIGRIMVESIDKDSKLRALQYTLEGVQIRLTIFEEAKKAKTLKDKDENEEKIEDVVQIALDKELKAHEKRKEEILKKTQKKVEELKSKSIANGNGLDKLNEDLKVNEERKEMVKINTDKVIEQITNGSFTNFENILDKEK
jgi:hypothetical protein